MFFPRGCRRASKAVPDGGTCVDRPIHSRRNARAARPVAVGSRFAIYATVVRPSLTSRLATGASWKNNVHMAQKRRKRRSAVASRIVVPSQKADGQHDASTGIVRRRVEVGWSTTLLGALGVVVALATWGWMYRYYYHHDVVQSAQLMDDAQKLLAGDTGRGYGDDIPAESISEVTKFEEAHRLIKRALALDPQSSRAHDMLGVCYEHIGHFDDAIVEYRYSMKLDPKVPDSHCNLAVLLERQGLFDAARREYDEAKRVAPQHANAYAGAGTLAIAQYEREGKRDRALVATAERELEHAIGLDPLRSEAYTMLGVAYELKGDIPAAVAAHEHALALAPHSRGAQYNLGALYMNTKRYEEAEKTFANLIVDRPTYAKGYMGLAQAAMARDHVVQAAASIAEGRRMANDGALREAYQQFREQYPSYVEDAEAQIRVRGTARELALQCPASN